ncbi:MAG: discoidin domain-containing protein [Ruminiclostridium sp.]|nr:discoidin domain-containing protein [Ruminiclostridium sp.]
MLKSLKIDYYSNGYSGMHTNCIDNPIAGAAGYYNYDNYFYYSFYYSIFKNWTSSKKYDWLTFREEILGKLGLRLKFNEITNPSELIASIKENIDNNCPIVMIVKYCTLFFLGSYLTDTKLNHAIAISDYDSEKKIIVIRECLLNKEVTQNVMRGDPFFKLQLTEDLISDMWLKSNNFFKDDKYIKFRYLLISKLHAQALREKHFDISKKNEIMDEIRKIDSELFVLLNELYLDNRQQQKVRLSENAYKKLVNYALGAEATADSEYNPNNDVHCKASQAVDGKWDIPAKDMWISTNLGSTHWLKADIGQSRAIIKFVIRHWNVPGYITVDFKIQGSCDGRKWRDLVVIKGNDSDITTHDIPPSLYRFFRLYITYPALNDFHARVYEFEAWGVSE